MTTLQIDLSDEQLADLDKIQSDCGFHDRRALINNALTMFKWAVENLKGGKSIAAVDDAAGKYREIEMPFMANLKP
jgi:hypothetical protein